MDPYVKMSGSQPENEALDLYKRLINGLIHPSKLPIAGDGAALPVSKTNLAVVLTKPSYHGNMRNGLYPALIANFNR